MNSIKKYMDRPKERGISVITPSFEDKMTAYALIEDRKCWECMRYH